MQTNARPVVHHKNMHNSPKNTTQYTQAEAILNRNWKLKYKIGMPSCRRNTLSIITTESEEYHILGVLVDRPDELARGGSGNTQPHNDYDTQ